MKIKFRDVSAGQVEARAIVELAPGVFLNEVTVIRRNGELEIELPKKSFKGKDARMHYLNILSFESEDKETLWLFEVKTSYLNWRKSNPKVLVYES